MAQSTGQILPVLRRLWRLALPLVLAQACFLGMNAVDTLFAGRFAATTLAGVGLGSSAIIAGYCLLMGICLGVAPAVGRALGAQVDAAHLGAWTRGALQLGLLLWSVLFLVFQVLAGPLAAWIAPEPATAAEMQAYLRWSTWGFPALGAFFVLRNVLEAHGHSAPTLFWGALALALNVVLDAILVAGWGPIPALGAAGVGLATSVVHVMLGLGMWWSLRWHPATRHLRLRAAPAVREGRREMWQLGLPIGLALLAESGLFALGGLLVAVYGTQAAAAHQVANTLSALAFMLQVGMGQALCVLISQALGARDLLQLQLAARAGIGSGLILAIAVAGLYALAGAQLVAAFSGDAEVQRWGAAFMLWAAVFHIFDALQALHAAGLRGLHQTGAVMRRTLVAYLGVAIPGMLLGVLYWQLPPTVIWWAFSAGLALAATLLGLRFWRELARLPALGGGAAPATRTAG